MRAVATRYVEVRILYATDRARGNGVTPATFYSGERGSKTLEFGSAMVSIPHDHSGGARNAHAVEAAVSRRSEEPRRAADHRTVGRRRPGIARESSWPSEGSGAKYTIDEANARWTQPHFKAFLERVLTQFGADTVHVIAHGMGSRVLAETIGSVNPARLPGASKLREFICAAPDFDAQTFAELAETFAGRGERFTLYAASSDLPLDVSKLMHEYGRAGGSPVVVDTIDTIDASNVSTSFLGHSYSATSAR